MPPSARCTRALLADPRQAVAAGADRRHRRCRCAGELGGDGRLSRSSGASPHAGGGLSRHRARAISEFPHIFLNQIVHVILRNVLDGCEDAFVLRAAELFFRPQKLTLHDGSLVAADEETVSGLGNKPLSPLVSMLGLPAAAEIDVLNEDNAASYWERSDLFDMALDLTAGRAALRRSARSSSAGSLILLRGRGRRSSRWSSCRTSRSPGMSASTPRPPASAMRCGRARSSTTPRGAASWGSTV